MTKTTSSLQPIPALQRPSHWLFILLAIFAGHNQTNAQVWSGTSAPTSVSWVSLASSADGTKMVAAASYPTWSVYTSTDSASTWAEATRNIGFGCVVASGDGAKLAGAQNFNGYIFTSTDSGATWTQTGAPQRTWLFMTSSTNGTKLAAVGQNGQPGPIQIYISGDSGKTWALTSAPATNWNALTSSADGTKLVAATGGNGSFYTSIDSGTNWTQQTNAPNEDWIAIASSAGGSTLVAAVRSGFGAGAPGPLYTSTNSGVTWTSNNVPVEWWTAVTCSADGSKLAAASANVITTPGGGVAVDQIVTSTPHLAMSMALPDANDVAVIWPWPANNYQLQQKLEATSTNWVYVTNVPMIRNYLSQVTLPLSAQRSFFRLINTNSP